MSSDYSMGAIIYRTRYKKMSKHLIRGKFILLIPIHTLEYLMYIVYCIVYHILHVYLYVYR